MKPLFTMREALADPNLLGDVLVGDSWSVWRMMLIAAMGEPLLDNERAIFKRFTGRAREPLQRVDEAAFVVGRRGGKDRAAATLAAYVAGCCEHPRLVRGERGVVMLLAPDQDQSTVTLNYIKAAFEASPILRQMVTSSSRDSLSLEHLDDAGNRVCEIDVEVRAASFRRLRGRTCVMVIATEAAFWYSDESSNPDSEILNAARPTLATTGGPLIIITSPYARRGETWSIYRRHYGPEGDPLVLVAQGASRDFNPTLSQSVVDRALERDHAAASAEYLAQFRTDVESFVAREAVDACVDQGVFERPAISGLRYRAFVDPSGGSADSMTVAIAHKEGDERVLDCLREVRPPFSPAAVVAEFATTLKSYRVSSVSGDRYGGEFCRELFRQHGIKYEPAAKPKSDLYRDALPLLNSRRVALLDHARLVNQLCGLERRTARGGRDSIDHAPGSHDDLANSACGALVDLGTGSTYTLDNVRGPGDPPFRWTLGQRLLGMGRL